MTEWKEESEKAGGESLEMTEKAYVMLSVNPHNGGVQITKKHEVFTR